MLPTRLQFLLPSKYRTYPDPIVPVVRLSGPIGTVMPLRTGLAMANVAPLLERAFSVPGAKAVALVINSPGGSAAQSHLIFRRIRAFAEEKKLPVIAFVEDAAASGGYMIACAADEIVADPSSIVGSIGVISASFGVEELAAKLGIERRLVTAGDQKSFLDPFRPVQPWERERLEQLLGALHTEFKAWVRARRGERLKGPQADLFNGRFWTGREALPLGLVDRLGDARGEIRRRFGEKARIVPFGAKRPPLPLRLLRGAAVMVEERAAWGQLGL